MAKSKKPAGDTLVAASAIAIEGKHFDAGAPIEDVSDEQRDVSVRSGRVITADEFAKRTGSPLSAPNGGLPDDSVEGAAGNDAAGD